MGRNSTTAGRAVRRRARVLVAAATVAALASGCQEESTVIPPHQKAPLVQIVTADSAESELVGTILSSALIRSGYRVQLHIRQGSDAQVVDAVERGEATLTVGYTGELMQRYDRSATARESAEVYSAMLAALPEGVTAADASPAQDEPAYVVSRNTSDTRNLRRMSDLRGRCGELVLGARREVLADTALSTAVGEVYDCSFSRRDTLPGNPRAVADSLRQGHVGVGVVQSSDPVLSMDDLVALDDDAHAITAQNLVPVYRKGGLDEEQLTLVNRISGELTTDALRELLRGFEFGSGGPPDLANYWLDQHDG